jgi:hypothetical protein
MENPMRIKSIALVAATAAFLPLAGFAQQADAEMTAKIEAALVAAGYQTWGDITFDGDEDAWNVSNVVGADGKHYRLQLDSDMKIVGQGAD